MKGSQDALLATALSLALCAIVLGIASVLAPETFSRPASCTCEGKPDDCRPVTIDIGEGRHATGVMWANANGKPRSCLRIPPKQNKIVPTG